MQTLVVARCEGITRLAKKLSLSGKDSKHKDNVDKICARALTPGALAGLLPLPEFPNKLPMMVANLKDLQVIAYESIGMTGQAEPGFERIASIDSPFREQVAWAFLTTIAHPGMPERDLKPWAEDFEKNASKVGATTSPTHPK